MKINLTISKNTVNKNIKYLKDRGIILPTFRQMASPNSIPSSISNRLNDVDPNDMNSYNYFRINWYNSFSGLNKPFLETPNFIELPKSLTGVDARIIALCGKYFPTGAHKVGSSYACLIPKIVTGQFDIQENYAVWPSTGNFCRGGAFNAAVIGCKSIAILPEGMSKERIDWLKKIAGEIILTNGSESNVKEIYDKVNELKTQRDNIVVFNQFNDYLNYLWHYVVTGKAICDVFNKIKDEKDRLAGICLSSGSSGTLASADYVKKEFPKAKLAVSEALQCPTLLNNGFGEHRIEGIGDKHIPWIHNTKNTDMIIGIDDTDVMNMFYLLNNNNGHDFLQKSLNVDNNFINNIDCFGISGVANILASVKFAKYYELNSNDIIVTILTDSSSMYNSRIAEMNDFKLNVPFDPSLAFAKSLLSLKTDSVEELNYIGKRRIHNLKYYTWIEQQNYDINELNSQWYDSDEYWNEIQKSSEKIDVLINNFNEGYFM